MLRHYSSTIMGYFEKIDHLKPVNTLRACIMFCNFSLILLCSIGDGIRHYFIYEVLVQQEHDDSKFEDCNCDGTHSFSQPNFSLVCKFQKLGKYTYQFKITPCTVHHFHHL